jgi:DNA-binding NtrC family response regulator
VICATNLSSEKLADPNLFRQDLLYRINTVGITLPPLRERREDIPLLLEHFIAEYAQKYNFPAKRLSAEALDALIAHTWPGNVRELRHAVERAIVLAEGTTFQAADFPLAGTDGPVSVSPDVSTLDALERTGIAKALERYEGNVSRTAKALGVTRASLYRRMEKYGLGRL